MERETVLTTDAFCVRLLAFQICVYPDPVTSMCHHHIHRYTRSIPWEAVGGSTVSSMAQKQTSQCSSLPFPLPALTTGLTWHTPEWDIWDLFKGLILTIDLENSTPTVFILCSFRPKVIVGFFRADSDADTLNWMAHVMHLSQAQPSIFQGVRYKLEGSKSLLKYLQVPLSNCSIDKAGNETAWS